MSPVAGEFFRAVVAQAKAAGLVSREHAAADDPGNPSVDFHGEKRGNETHESTTDPDAKLARTGMGKEAKLSYSGE